MKNSIVLIFFLQCITGAVWSQKILPHITNRYFDLTGTIGNAEGTIAGSYNYNWYIGSKSRFEVGLGLRVVSYSGTKKQYYTAPARLARTTTFPFAVVFAGHKENNIDTLTVQRPLTGSLNLAINFGYNITERWYAGFNIDLIGFTVGRGSSGILHTNGETITESLARPSGFNLLLTGDNDLGSLDSEFFLKYNLKDRWGIKAVYQFLFSEYKTSHIKQIAPDGTEVNQFRNKVNAFGLGITYDFQ